MLVHRFEVFTNPTKPWCKGSVEGRANNVTMMLISSRSDLDRPSKAVKFKNDRGFGQMAQRLGHVLQGHDRQEPLLVEELDLEFQPRDALAEGHVVRGDW